MTGTAAASAGAPAAPPCQGPPKGPRNCPSWNYALDLLHSLSLYWVELIRQEVGVVTVTHGAESLREAIRAVEDPPCETPDRCSQWSRCATTGETCQAFRQYLLAGKWSAVRGASLMGGEVDPCD